MVTASGSRAATRPFVIATLLYSALALVLTYPLILHLTSVVPSDLGDPLLTTSILWWNAHAVPLTERWWNGFAFAPSTGMLAFSDHRLGVSLIATPLQWLGASPLTAYNVVFLLTFPLCAIAAHYLGYTLTKRHDAAAICGLSFGFSPFRIAHLSHLELLAAFGMPIGLAALHLFQRDRRIKWMVVFALALIVQGICATYYLLFFFVLLGLWMIWFVRDWRTVRYITAACAACGVTLLPIAIKYREIHAFHGFQRLWGEVTTYSGDISSIVTASSRMTIWGFTYALSSGPERELFPGLTIIVLAIAGFVIAFRKSRAADAGLTDTAWRRTSIILLLAAIGAAAVSFSFTLAGPWSVGGGLLRLRVTDGYKPASIGLLLFAIGLLLRPATRRPWQRRSLLGFYLFAAAWLFLLSTGPSPTFLEEEVLYAAPYRWLMSLPLFGTSVRVPARFAMPAILALGVAAALAFDRLRLTPITRRALGIAAIVGIIADGWIRPLELPPPPDMWPVPAHYDFGPVVELPLAFVPDFSAMYRATLHGHPVVNGQSGFNPVHYRALQLAFEDGNPRGLNALMDSKPLLIVIDRQLDPAGRWNHIIEQAEGVTRVGRDDRWTFYGLPAQPRFDCHAPDVSIASATYADAPLDLRPLQDNDVETAWQTPGAQQLNDTVQLELGRESQLCSLRLSLGVQIVQYPRDLDVTTSVDGVAWVRQFKGSPAGLMVRGALDDPHNVWLTVPLHDAAARFVRLRLDSADQALPWLIAELRVTGRP